MLIDICVEDCMLPKVFTILGISAVVINQSQMHDAHINYKHEV